MKKVLAVIFLIGLVIALFVLFQYYTIVLKPNTNFETEKEFFIKTGTNFEGLINQIETQNLLKDNATFIQLAQKMNLPNHVYAGKYLFEPNLNNQQIIKQLRSGIQAPVKVVFNKERTLQNLASTVSKQIEMDSASFVNLIADSNFLKKNKLSKETAISIFIPNTYEMYWNSNAEKFTKRMLKEYKNFWTTARIAKLKKQKLTTTQAQTIASIVAEETNQITEMERIAGVYLNRVKKGWKLEADPTVKFGFGDFTLKRILNKHLKHDSPYNTYKYKGIPPGPICTANQKEIDAVLNAEEHSYMYFCAKEDFSGFHNFAKTLKEHNNNAKLYHRALNKKKIFK